jgi:hypothetical protein
VYLARCDGSDKGTASNFVQISGKSAKRSLEMLRQAFREESMSSRWKNTNSQRPKKVRQVKRKVKRMLIIFFNIEGIVHKECFLEGQTVNSTYYCDVLW